MLLDMGIVSIQALRHVPQKYLLELSKLWYTTNVKLI